MLLLIFIHVIEIHDSKHVPTARLFTTAHVALYHQLWVYLITFPFNMYEIGIWLYNVEDFTCMIDMACSLYDQPFIKIFLIALKLGFFGIVKSLESVNILPSLLSECHPDLDSFDLLSFKVEMADYIFLLRIFADPSEVGQVVVCLPLE